MAAWDTIRSKAEAENLRNEGRLEPILLMPAKFGGVADAANVVLVPPTAREERDGSSPRCSISSAPVARTACPSPRIIEATV
ncbi:hypothetical protein KCP91_16860 [Microvirga sp. SRT01]|uniref:Uncharacterized protein n=1 Tax=Sphingomonas longa TaxID=2778730 RepID=A0ABS2DAU2_9SPHN|nr:MULTISPECIES: hypothetical protein [Alphaproteobacteria]MBM6578057.1 hypothetical protein [Sphingomonas sp. BT552]MBR7711098.1 hypothetical protein [Microvirga sp. SRT01]